MRWDLDSLMAAADGFEVAKAIGMKTKECGTTIFAESVDGRNERNIQHNKLFKNGCFDFTTREGRNVYGMVRDYYANKLGTSLTHDEICEIIADTCGGKSQFIISNTPEQKKKERPFPLSKGELELIGLDTKPKYNPNIVSVSLLRDKEHTERIIEKNGNDLWAKTTRMPPMNIYILFRKNPDAFWDIVANKTQECLEKLRRDYKYAKSLPDNKGTTVAVLRQEMMKMLEDDYTKTIALRAKIASLCPRKKAA